MATRRHLLLARIADRERLAGILGSAESASTGPWCWRTAPALAESHDELKTKSLKAGCPFLLFTTFDDGWRVSASTGAGNLDEATHEFRKDWRTNNNPAAQCVDRLVEIIRSVATGADAAALREALSGRAIQPVEEESDLGDLPRLLDIIGARGIIEIPQAPPAQKPRKQKATLTASLEKGHEGRPRAPISGIAIETENAADFAALAPYCDPEALVSLVARGDVLPEIVIDAPCKIVREHDSLFVEAEGGIGLKANVINLAAKQIALASGLHEITVLSGRRRGGKDIGWHRYSGSVENGRWLVAEATPFIVTETLAAALELIALRRADAPIECESEAEADKIAALCAQSLYLGGKTPGRMGSSLIPTEGTRFYVLMECFKFRFEKIWSVAASRRTQ